MARRGAAVARALVRRTVRAALALRGDQCLLAVLLFLLVYFSYHAVSGSRGLLALLELRREIAATEAELDRVAAERAALERRVERMRPESLDLELLDERARATLGLIHEDEVIVLFGDEAAAAGAGE